MKKLIFTVLLALGILACAPAFAFDLDYFGAIQLKFIGKASGDDPNSIDLTLGADGNENLWGVGILSSIYTDTGNNAQDQLLWSNGDGGEEIAYLIKGVDYNSYFDLGAGSKYLGSVGGEILLYSQAAGTYQELYSNASFDGSGNLVGFNSITNLGTTGGQELARILFAPGVYEDADAVHTLQTLIDENSDPVKLFSSTLGNIDLTGPWNTQFASMMNTNTFYNNTDVVLGINLEVLDTNSTSPDFNLKADDPLRANVTPEPVSSALFLLGGASLVALRRKKSE